MIAGLVCLGVFLTMVALCTGLAIGEAIGGRNPEPENMTDAQLADAYTKIHDEMKERQKLLGHHLEGR